ILVAKGHAALVESNEPAVRDGDAMGVAGEIGKHCLWSGEGRLGIDEPFLALERREMRGEGLAATQALDRAQKRQPACRVSIDERRQEEPPEQAGKHAHRQKEPGLAAYPVRPVERYAATRYNHMNVRMVAPTPTIP